MCRNPQDLTAPVQSWSRFLFAGAPKGSHAEPILSQLSIFATDRRSVARIISSPHHDMALGRWFSRDWSRAGGTDSACFPVACETQNDWLSTIRLRGGIAADRVLFCVTGGGAFGDIRANVNGSTWNMETKAGWTAGAGIEAAFTDNWTARVEYLFVDLQDTTFNPPAIPVTVKFSNTLVRVGVDYKFR